MTTPEPMRPVYLGFQQSLLVSIGWLRDETDEVIEVLDHTNGCLGGGYRSQNTSSMRART